MGATGRVGVHHRSHAPTSHRAGCVHYGVGGVTFVKVRATAQYGDGYVRPGKVAENQLAAVTDDPCAWKMRNIAVPMTSGAVEGVGEVSKTAAQDDADARGAAPTTEDRSRFFRSVERCIG